MRLFRRPVLIGIFWASLIVCSPIAFSQMQSGAPQPPDKAGQASQSGSVSTGGAHAPVLDTQNRPITAGGFVDTGPIVFKDVADSAGLTKWKHAQDRQKKNTFSKPWAQASRCSITTTMAGSTSISSTAPPSTRWPAKPRRRTPRSSTTTTTAPSPTSPQKPA